MYTHLLIAIDDSVLAHGALEQGVALAKVLNAKVTVVTVTEPWHAVVAGDAVVGFPVDDFEKSNAAWAADILNKAEGAARQADVPCRTVHVKDSYAAEGILETAQNEGCDLIVMASHGRRGVTRLLLGSQTNEVLSRSSIPVLVCR